ncbi:hypothetical protein ETB97_009864, partial [Aspergillus alliaceus]
MRADEGEIKQSPALRPHGLGLREDRYRPSKCFYRGLPPAMAHRVLGKLQKCSLKVSSSKAGSKDYTTP